MPVDVVRPAVICWAILLASSAHARPFAPERVCQDRPDYAACLGGVPDCAICHTSTPPDTNVYGTELALRLSGFVAASPEPEAEAFATWLTPTMAMIADLDADGDGATNEEELLEGTAPGDPASVPSVGRPPGAYDPVQAYIRVHLDFCGTGPEWEALQEVRAASSAAQIEHVHTALDACLQTEFWRGADGRVWRMGDEKIQPIGGPSETTFDYGGFVRPHLDGNDVREVLTADYIVYPVLNPGQTYYEAVPAEQGHPQGIPQDRRAGVLTSMHFLTNTIMFSSIPRTAAARVYRHYLGLDMTRLEGLQPVSSEPGNYDGSGVDAPECAYCHSTLDPLTYPFTRYHGLTGDYGTYDPNRLDTFVNEPRIQQMPEAGVIFGQSVSNLPEWARVAANSEAYAKKVVLDYWRLIFDREPLPVEKPEYEALWRSLMTTHQWRVFPMLHDLVDTETYGLP